MDMQDKKGTERPVSRARPVIDDEACKGCGRCVAACPRKVLRMRTAINRRGILSAEYGGAGCTGCGVCFYNCPEFNALKIEKT